VTLNAQVPDGSRYERHVDSNAVEGLLYVTTHTPGEGGELVVANDSSASDVALVDANCSTLHPQAGTLVLFDARRHRTMCAHF
jgi:2OG-Fe(II) oxygenase superfamily